MNLTHSLANSQKRLAKFGGPKYQGPADGRSRKASGWVRPVITAAAKVTSRMSVEGLENVPETGGNIYCPNHPATSLDVYLPHIFAKGDLRPMVRMKRFESETMAELSEATGHYPVDRNNASQVTKDHTLEILSNDGDVLIFPEGRFSEKTGQVNPLKRGAASFAYKAAQRVVPVGYHFQADPEPRPLENILAAAGAGAIGVLAGTLGSPLAGGMLGAAVGSKLARWAARKVLPKFESDKAMSERLNHDPIIMAGVSVAGGLLGGALGAVSGAICSLPSALGVGLGAFSLMRDYIHRPVTKIKIGEAIDLKPFKKMEKRAANTAITEELHRRIGHLVSDLSGIPYDESAPKIYQGHGNPET